MKKYALYVTNQCNMNCDYCYRKDFRDINIPLEDIQNTINNILNVEDNDIRIEFLGGEPLLVYNRIDSICNYIKFKYPEKNIKYSLTTNGTILNRNVRDIVDRHKIKIYVSIDGDESMHNMHRKFNNGEGSYKFIDWKPNEVELVHITVSKETVSNMYKNILYLYNEGFKRISIGVVNADINKAFLSVYKEQSKLAINKLHQCDDAVLLPYFESPKYALSFESISDTLEQAIEKNANDIDKINNELYFYYKSLSK